MAFTKEKRKKIENLVIETMSKLDESNYNSNKYKEFFKSMSDEKFTKFMNDFLKDDSENFYLEIESLITKLI